MQSPAPASSLAEPPPAASPRLGRWIHQQGLRSPRIRDLLVLLVLAADSAAAAAASTTTAIAFLCLVTLSTGMIKNSYRVSNVYVRIRRTWVLILPFVVIIHHAMQQEFVAWLILPDLDGRQYTCIILTASSDTGIRVVILYAWFEKLLSGRDERGFFARSGKV